MKDVLALMLIFESVQQSNHTENMFYIYIYLYILYFPFNTISTFMYALFTVTIFIQSKIDFVQMQNKTTGCFI